MNELTNKTPLDSLKSIIRDAVKYELDAARSNADAREVLRWILALQQTGVAMFWSPINTSRIHEDLVGSSAIRRFAIGVSDRVLLALPFSFAGLSGITAEVLIGKIKEVYQHRESETLPKSLVSSEALPAVDVVRVAEDTPAVAVLYYYYALNVFNESSIDIAEMLAKIEEKS